MRPLEGQITQMQHAFFHQVSITCTSGWKEAACQSTSIHNQQYNLNPIHFDDVFNAISNHLSDFFATVFISHSIFILHQTAANITLFFYKMMIKTISASVIYSLLLRLSFCSIDLWIKTPLSPRQSPLDSAQSFLSTT